MTYPGITLPQMLQRTVERRPEATALVYSGARLSYAQLDEHVNRCAAGLQALGVRQGDRVALMMANYPQFVIAYFGVLQAGGIVTATSSMYTAREAAHQWKDAGARALIVERSLLPVARAAFETAPELKHVILTGPREYSAASLARLD